MYYATKYVLRIIKIVVKSDVKTRRIFVNLR